MSSVLKITVKGLTEIVKKLEAEQKNILRTLKKAHTRAAADGVRILKRGLSYRAGRNPGDKKYENSPVGSLPYGHSMHLRKSIGLKVLASGKQVTIEMGSGAREGTEVEYAKYLEGRNGDGIRPFLEYAQGCYNPQTIKAYFAQYYKPLSGDK